VAVRREQAQLLDDPEDREGDGRERGGVHVRAHGPARDQGRGEAAEVATDSSGSVRGSTLSTVIGSLLRIVTLLAAVAVAGCDRGDPGCYDRSEAHVRISVALASIPRPPEGQALEGFFSVWGPGEVVFDLGGAAVGFDLELEADAPLPDLSRDTVGEVILTGWGFESSSDRPTEPTIVVEDLDGGTLLVLGNGEWAAEGSPWSITAPRDLDTCSSYEHDRGLARIKPAYITFDGATERLLQGDEVSLGGLDVRLLSAQSNNRSHPWAPCSTADCPWEKLSWMAADPALTMIAPPPG
jgi:hypothetical protein